ncbi:MAG: F0F1 ATP synthase subunit A [Thermoleophilia bacterium]|nr:F0F1 ATP synthase subunit A [Thermoleophilia bacterium]
MELSPDSTVFWSRGPVHLNLTIVTTWAVMALIVFLAWLATRGHRLYPPFSRSQSIFEAVVTVIRNHIRDMLGPDVPRYLPFIGTLFLFISFSNLLIIFPVYHPPTSSLSTTVALALCVFFAVPIYGIANVGVKGYLKHYIEPSVILLPLHVMGEAVRTLTLAVRLFGSMMSEILIAGALLAILPFLLPVVMKAFGLLIGQIQAYIFAMLASIYIASASSAREHVIREKRNGQKPQSSSGRPQVQEKGEQDG